MDKSLIYVPRYIFFCMHMHVATTCLHGMSSFVLAALRWLDSFFFFCFCFLLLLFFFFARTLVLRRGSARIKIANTNMAPIKWHFICSIPVPYVFFVLTITHAVVGFSPLFTILHYVYKYFCNFKCAPLYAVCCNLFQRERFYYDWLNTLF